MGKQYRPVGFLGFAVLAVSLSAACGGALPPDQQLARATTNVARVDVLEGRECGASASVASMPEHCELSARAGRSWLLTADVQFVAAVEPDGRPSSVKVLKAPEGFDLEEAVVDCAMHGSYAVPIDSNGAASAETCPITLRLRRYASDSGRKDPPPIPCPIVQPYSAHGYFGAGSMGEATGSTCVTR